jgi:phospholipase/carboxylesterase
MRDNQMLHQGQEILNTGERLNNAAAAMILVHGRGASAESILTLTEELNQDGFAFLAPQAANATWYPYSFLAPIEKNEPWLTSALQVLENTREEIQKAGIPASRTIILGFSQGACVGVEFIARFPQRYGGVAALSGGLIGPLDKNFSYPGSLENTPVFIGCSDMDPHIPLERVHQTSETLRQLRAQVTERIYPGMGHLVNQDEIEQVQNMMKQLMRS